ncbi:MAG TPA: alpha/beta fold hydrolase, partial [Longimicrobium sp.]
MRCLTVRVPEDRERPRDGSVALHVVVVSPATPGDADPVFFFTGGPGQAASDGLQGTLHELAGVLATRDLVLIDQRGTGPSQPLRCDLDRTEDALRGWLTGGFPRAAIRACRERLLARGINPARYATADAVMDAEAVRGALGYERVNLLGISYGTRVALEFLRRYPHHVRTATLRGLHAPDSEFPRHVAGDA